MKLPKTFIKKQSRELIKLLKKLNKAVNSFPAKDIEKIQFLMNEYLKTKDESSIILSWERVRDGKAKKGDNEKVKKLYAKIKNADALLNNIYLVIKTEGLLLMLHKGADLGKAYRFKTIHPIKSSSRKGLPS